MEESVSLLGQIRHQFGGKAQDVRSYSPLPLAYLGDAVYDLIIRSVLVGQANRPVNELNQRAEAYVNAKAQSRLMERILDCLTEEEAAVYRRGRNAHPRSAARNASWKDYREATGLEALIGYLYLTERVSRILELVKAGIEKSGEKEIPWTQNTAP
ncbi:MAG: ribonuclease III [Clostridium sp.]|jgi:ribonuclease-3 family protein|nr:ribonuclease III [Clostridium sp.]